MRIGASSWTESRLVRGAAWLRRSRPAQKIVGVGVLAVALLVAMTAWLAVTRYNEELNDAARELRTLDLLLAEEAARSLQSVELVLQSVIEQVVTDDVASAEAFVTRESTMTMHEYLRARVAGVPQLDAVTMISAEGKLINFSRAWPIPDVNLADRDYFRFLQDHRTDEPFLTEPVLNRGSGTPTIYLARRISAPDGTLVGLVLGAIELSYFERLYTSLHLNPNNFIALWRRDGVLLARYPPAAIGQRIDPQDITSPAALWHGVQGVFEKSWTIDGGAPEWRVVASEAVRGFPLQVNIGRSKTFILADWRAELISIGSAVAVSVLCIVALVWALLRRFHAYEAVAAASREREREIVARQQVEEALRQSQKLEAIGQLTGGVAHDFNNLLTVIRTSVELLTRSSLTEERRQRYLGSIKDATDRGAKLTGQLLAFARRQSLDPQVFDVGENVAALADLMSRLTGARIRVTTRLAEDPCHVEADPNQFDTSILNMAVNARDAMAGEGDLILAVRAVAGIPALRAHPAVAGEFVAVSLRDSGSGLAEDMLERVFEPFFTTKKVGEGTGLGLSQVLGFAKQSGGDVRVESTPGQGTTFTLYLPRVAARPNATPSPAAVPMPPGRPLRVLVVEDNEHVGRLTVQMLIELGHDTAWAKSGEEALHELGRQPDRFDLVFSDVVMPGMSGLDLGRIIRQRHATLPVVLASGFSHVLAEHGADGFVLLRKPYSLDDLNRALRSAAA